MLGLLVLTFTEAEIAIRLLAAGVRGFVIRLRKGGVGVIRHDPIQAFTILAPETYIAVRVSAAPSRFSKVKSMYQRVGDVNID